MSKICIRRSQLGEIVTHCREEFPKEACGIVSGRTNARLDGIVEKVYRTANIAKNSYARYLADPEELGRIFDEIYREKLKILAIYHSHINYPAYPSKDFDYELALDGESARYPGVFYLIISLDNLEEPVIKAYTIRKGEIREEEVEIID